MNQEKIIEKARAEIESLGWEIDIQEGEGGFHLVCTKDGERRAWGLFELLTCWSEAYRAITGRDILSLRDFE